MDVLPATAVNAVGNHANTGNRCARPSLCRPVRGPGGDVFIRQHAEPSLARYALAAGIGTLCLILAVSGVVEWYAGHVNGQIVIAVFIELFTGIAFLLSNSVGKKHATGKPGRVKDK